MFKHSVAESLFEDDDFSRIK